jgi:hypothetical protein
VAAHRLDIALLIGIILSGCSPSDRPEVATKPGSDSGFTALQSRGARAMGVDQYTSAHVFEPLPDGGRIVLTRDATDTAGVETIRDHMRLIAGRFARGDFQIPGFVHAQTVPGTAVMASRRSRISYVADTLQGGGQLRITTTDSAALTAVHQFLAFQRQDHRAPAHEHD